MRENQFLIFCPPDVYDFQSSPLLLSGVCVFVCFVCVCVSFVCGWLCLCKSVCVLFVCVVCVCVCLCVSQ